MDGEIWKPIPGYGGHYEASSLGRIRVKDRVIRRKHSTGSVVDFFYKGRLLNPTRTSKLGHLQVTLGQDGVDRNCRVHQLVLLAFVGPAPAGTEGCHNDGNAYNNAIANLRWDTHLNNNRDRKEHGGYEVGEDHPMAKLTWEAVREIRALALDGWTGRDLAKKYGVTPTTIGRILMGRNWKEEERCANLVRKQKRTLLRASIDLTARTAPPGLWPTVKTTSTPESPTP